MVKKTLSVRALKSKEKVEKMTPNNNPKGNMLKKSTLLDLMFLHTPLNKMSSA